MIAIIPARGGSKRLPRKNVMFLNEKPLIYYTIKCAQDSNCFSKIYVSTEDEEVKEWSLYYGADVIDRPVELAQDSSSSIDVVKHAIQFSKNKGNIFCSFMLLQPTSPLRSVEDIIFVKNLLYQEMDWFDSVVSVCNTGLGEYKFNGSIYACGVDFFEEYDVLWNEKSFLYQMGKERSIDIDTIEDFKLAEELMKGKLEESEELKLKELELGRD